VHNPPKFNLANYRLIRATKVEVLAQLHLIYDNVSDATAREQ